MSLHDYKSRAKIYVIPEFRVSRPCFSSDGNAMNYRFLETGEKLILNFPSIITSDGTPWNIANSYLLNLSLQAPPISISLKGIRGVADDLLNYLRFLEDQGLDLFYLPSNERLRVTYRYRNHIQDLVLAGAIKRSTGKQRINRVVRFYKGLLSQGLVLSEELKNLPYEVLSKTITSLDSKGFVRKTTVHTHNLKLSGVRDGRDFEAIVDEGALRPLPREDQRVFLRALKATGNRAMQLIFYLALFTGARIQTCCTIRIKNLDGKLDSSNNYRMRIGAGTGIDNKNSKNMMLIIPGWLVQDLKLYSVSNKARAAQEKSELGISKENYLFLTNRGKPYYTSKLEISQYIERDAEIDKSRKTEISINEETTIRVFLAKVHCNISKEYPGFYQYRFHDFRATFGMNLLEMLLNNPLHNTNSALIVLQQRMGHQDLETTMRYLSYRNNINIGLEVQDSYESQLLDLIQS